MITRMCHGKAFFFFSCIPGEIRIAVLFHIGQFSCLPVSTHRRCAVVAFRLFVTPVVALDSHQWLTSNADRAGVVGSPVTLKCLVVVA